MERQYSLVSLFYAFISVKKKGKYDFFLIQLQLEVHAQEFNSKIFKIQNIRISSTSLQSWKIIVQLTVWGQ